MSSHPLTEQLRPLPVRADEVWQGGLLEIPGIVRVGKLFVRPTACLWVSTATAKVAMSRPGPAEAVTPDVVAATLVQLATREGYRPGRVQVADPAYAAAVADVVAALGITLDVVERLAGVEFMADHLAKEMSGDPAHAGGPPALTDDRRITADRLADFADAAAAFYAAAPWAAFGPTDLVRVAAPAGVPAALRFVNVMGGGGEQFGLAFFASPADFAALVAAADPGQYAAGHAMVSVTFDTDQMIPTGDVTAWRRLKLATAKRGRRTVYPFPVTFNRGRWIRPTAAELAVMEGLLRAFATLAPGGLAADGTSVDVATADGPVRFTLEWAEASADVDGLPRVDVQSLIDQARGATGRRAAMLAERAVAMDPDAVEAHVLLGQRAATPAAAVAHFRRGVAAGRRVLGEAAFADRVGDFWYLLETRPYMRALGGLAEALRRSGQPDAAIEAWQEMLRLNPGDNQGIRDPLTAVLLERGRDADAAAVLAAYPDEDGAVHTYAAALLRYRADGDAPAAAAAVATAVRSNPHVAAYLTGDKPPPRQLPATYAMGSVEEAKTFAADLRAAWAATPGAADWLRSRAPAPRRAGRVKGSVRSKRPPGL